MGSGLFSYFSHSAFPALSFTLILPGRSCQRWLHSSVSRPSTPHGTGSPPPHPQIRVRRHFRHLWSERSILLNVGESEIISQLSTPLRAEALRYM